MKSIPQYNFYKTKYGDELLIDVVELRSIEKYILKNPIHRLSYYDLTLITEGNGEFAINKYSYPIQPNDIVCSIPGEIRGWKQNNNLNGYALIFKEEFLLSFFNDPHFLQNLPFLHPNRVLSRLTLHPDLYARIYQSICNIKSEIHLNLQKDNHILRALLYEVLMLLNREYIASGVAPNLNEVSDNRHIQTFIKWVNTDFMSHRSTTYYANKLCITPGYLNEIVQQSMGISAKLYIQNKVIQEAQNLLTYTSLSIAQISERLHYSTPSYFVRSFHKYTGLTPHQYRKSGNHEK